MTENIFVAVAWPYANGHLHLGHIAGCYLPADIFARYHRIVGNNVLMVSGSDCHGTPVTLRAESEGKSPYEVAQKYHSSFVDSWNGLGIGFDLFTTTMTENHRLTTQEIFTTLYSKGYIYSDKMKVAYSPNFDRFLPDRYVTGTCPHCSNLGARGDQCDECGQTLDPVELINPVYFNDGKEYLIEIRDEEHLFLRLSAFENDLLNWIHDKDYWRSNVRNFTKGFLEGGLKDRAITRDIDWGVPVPLDGYEKKRIYVWFEAVIGYLSASKEWAQKKGTPDAWRVFWEDPSTLPYYFIGKDNIPFHTIIWPAIIRGFGDFNLPYDVPANEFLSLEGKQLSTSRNWAVWVPDYLEKFSPDPLRYVLASNMPEHGDADFSWREFVRRNNDELVATYGNLVNRVLNMLQRSFGGIVPDYQDNDHEGNEIRILADQTLKKVGENINNCHFREALNQGAMGLASRTNKYLEQKAPWKTAKTDIDATAVTLTNALYVLATLKTVMYPFLPFSSRKLHELLGFQDNMEENGWKINCPKPGTKLPIPVPLFDKLDESILEI